MNKSLLALTITLLFAGTVASSASAQEVIYYGDELVFAAGDMDGDGIPNRNDPVDDRFDDDGNMIRFEVGSFLPEDTYGSEFYLDANLYGLARPAMGYRWSRLGNHAYLVSTSDGMIVDAVYNLFPR